MGIDCKVTGVGPATGKRLLSAADERALGIIDYAHMVAIRDNELIRIGSVKWYGRSDTVFCVFRMYLDSPPYGRARNFIPVGGFERDTDGKSTGCGFDKKKESLAHALENAGFTFNFSVAGMDSNHALNAIMRKFGFKNAHIIQ